MKKIYIVLGVILVLASCKNQEIPKEWVYSETINLEGVNPIGLALADDALWLSDGDHNRLVKINDEGKIIQTIDSLDRPMHIDASKGTLFIPQYGNDKVETVDNKGRFEFKVGDSLDAPAGVSVWENQRAVVDFYNNRVLFFDGADWNSFGIEGKKEGQFYYPTDVQITDSLIWVADAYNNRIQVFDKMGKFVKMMGQDLKMNAATGIFVSKEEVFVTDFENDRILVFDHEGNLKQELKEGIAKATDLLIKDGKLHIINYRTGELVLYELNELEIDS